MKIQIKKKTVMKEMTCSKIYDNLFDIIYY